jgi:hypothetical protein
MKILSYCALAALVVLISFNCKKSEVAGPHQMIYTIGRETYAASDTAVIIGLLPVPVLVIKASDPGIPGRVVLTTLWRNLNYSSSSATMDGQTQVSYYSGNSAFTSNVTIGGSATIQISDTLNLISGNFTAVCVNTDGSGQTVHIKGVFSQLSPSIVP